MERETKKIKSPQGTEFEIKTYLTAVERNEVMRVMLKGTKVSLDNVNVADDISGDVLLEARDKLIEIAVVSINGSRDNLKQQIENLRPTEYDWLAGEIDKLFKENF